MACLILGGFPAAVVAVIFAFYHGGGRVLAFIAFALVSLQAILVSFMLSIEVGLYPMVIAVIAVGCLGWYGVVRAKRHPFEPRAPRWQESLPLPPLSLAPTSMPVTPENIVGGWQFYFDRESKTVKLDFRADGTYAQTILDNRGGVTECPGGTWKLIGPTVELSGYVTLHVVTATSLSWWMVDAPLGLVLFGGDDPDSFVAWNRIARS